MKLKTLIQIQLIIDIYCLISFPYYAIKNSDLGFGIAAFWVFIAMVEHLRDLIRHYDQ